MMMGILQPAPAAGNDDPKASGLLDVPNKVASSLPAESTTMA